MVLKLRNSGGGVGDQICGLYVCQALKEKYPFATVEYYSKYPEWLIDAIDIEIKPYHHYFIEPPAKIDLYLNSSSREYLKKTKFTRKEIYADKVAFNKLVPVRPRLKRSYTLKNNYILLVPFAAWRNREWPFENWLKLENRLIENGYKTLILAQENRKEEIQQFSGEKVFGLTPAAAINVILDSSLVVANDSGMAHVAGMYNVPTVAVISHQFNGQHLFSETNVSCVESDFTQCTGCRKVKNSANYVRCRDNCESLNTISPEKVFDTITKITSEKKIVFDANNCFVLDYSGINDNNRDLVSILIPCYNATPKYLKESIDSCINQDWMQKEVVVVDDGSTRLDTQNFLKNYAEEKHLKIVFLKENVGISRALNIGLQHCSSEFVARMDADDIMVEGRLSEQMNFLKKNESITLVGGITQLFNEKGTITTVNHPIKINKKTIKENDWFLSHSAVTFRKSIVLKEGGYTQRNNYPEDFELWYRLLSRGYKMINLPKVVLKYRKFNTENPLTKNWFRDNQIVAGEIKNHYKKNPEKNFTAIPKTIHFIYGLSYDFGGKSFGLIHYLAIKSAKTLNPDFNIMLHCHYEPSGEWWEKAKKMLEIKKVKIPEKIFDSPLLHFAHKSDVLRLQILKKHGGIYLDIDTICVKPFDDELLNNFFVIGREYVSENVGGLCNAVLMSVKDHPFIDDWLDSYKTFRSKGRDEFWGEHSIKKPVELVKKHEKHVKILDHKAFHFPSWSERDLKILFEENWNLAEAYVHHLWESFSWDKYLKNLTVDSICTKPTTYNMVARKFLKDEKNVNEKIFSAIYINNIWGSMESRSGSGSELETTKSIRNYLPAIVKQYGISSIADIPCGDWNWMSRIIDNLGIHTYSGFDVVPDIIHGLSNKYAHNGFRFYYSDVTEKNFRLEKHDLVITRDFLQHLDNEACLVVMEKIKKSGSSWLLVTNYNNGNTDDISSGSFRRLDLSLPPFNLKFEKEFPEDFHAEFGRCMKLVRISDL